MLGEKNGGGFHRSSGHPPMGLALFKSFQVGLPVGGVVLQQVEHEVR